MYNVENIMSEFEKFKSDVGVCTPVTGDSVINRLELSSAAKAVIKHLVIMEMSEAEMPVGTTYLITTLNEEMYDELEYTVNRYINKETRIEETRYDLFIHSCGVLQFYEKCNNNNFILVNESKTLEQLEMKDIGEHQVNGVSGGVDIIHGELRRILDNYGSTTAIEDYLKEASK